jgi:uncharacterized protein Yka (UPF0111/DUF47 family)
MDPVSIIGVAASVLTLADTAFKLSKTLYTFSSELSSASEEIHELADDLEDFSNSLKHLSKLLNDSSSWFSDEIHHLTIKIIQKCAKLYEHIDQMLTKLGSKDKSTVSVFRSLSWRENLQQILSTKHWVAEYGSS